MKILNYHTQLAVDYYKPLLERYARFIIRNEIISNVLVKQVLNDQIKIDGLASSNQLRQLLKIDLLNRCLYWKLALVFDRPLVAVPSIKSFDVSLKSEKYSSLAKH